MEGMWDVLKSISADHPLKLSGLARKENNERDRQDDRPLGAMLSAGETGKPFIQELV